eukprot:snap_masked-scaffold_21-processed-gene-4.3-mRNA-1 protein AED:1.00 eAED:1.00 QI:0/-1/0/0/-1/1/1/0/510
MKLINGDICISQKFLDVVGDTKEFYLYVLILGISNASDAIEVTSFSYILELITFEKYDRIFFLVEDKFWSGFLTASVYIGMLFGGILSGLLADFYGRKTLLLFSLSMNCFGSFLLTFTNFISGSSWSLKFLLLFVSRACAGFGIGGTIPATFSLVSEISGTKLKNFSINIVACFWMIGQLYTSLTAFFLLSSDLNKIREKDFLEAESSWPIFAFIAAAPAGICLILSFYFVPESPVFLESKGKNDEAANVLQKYFLRDYFETQNLDESNTLLQGSELSKYDVLLSLIENLHSNTAEISQTSNLKEEISNTIPVFVGLDSVAKFNSAFLVLIWFTLSFSSYGILSWSTVLFTKTGFSNPYIISIIFSISTLPGNFVAINYPKFFQTNHSLHFLSRLLCLQSLFLSFIGLSFFFFGVVLKNNFVLLLGSFLFQTSSTACWNALSALTTENYPTSLRALSYGLLSAFGRIGGIAANLVNGYVFNTYGTSLVLGVDIIIIVIGVFAAYKIRVIR